MKFPAPVTLNWIAELINAQILGDGNAQASGINEIHRVEQGDLVFVDHPKYYDKCLQSAATFIIINNKDVAVPDGKALMVVEEPFESYLKIVNHFRPFTAADKAISPSAQVGEGTIIMPNVFIGNHVKIGNNCVIHPNVSLMDYTEMGNNVVIQAGTVVGSDAFYYNTKKNRDVWYKRMTSCGNVIIEDDVEIGASCCIDRGVTATTLIGRGTKIDNLVHVGHDNIIGQNCLLAAQVGIAGGTELKDGVVLWGQVGVNKTITIGSNAVVFGQSGVISNIEGNNGYWGTPAINVVSKKRESVWVKRIPELWKKVMGD
jgi:UDP-3-O-[3-hydroxymyristoyl] glucosamine N-acyltransferase